MATGDKLVNLDELKLVYDKLHVPSVQVQIPTGQWSGSSTRTYTVNATGVTANTIVDWAMDSSINYLTSDLTVTPGSGTITFSTPTLPAGTINVTLFFPGVNGEVVIQTLADVYSKSQTDALIAQSTALITTGSLHDLAGRNGIFWLTSAVTDKPEPGGGMLLMRSYNNSYCCGLYVVADNGKAYTVNLANGVWTYRLLAFA